MAKKGISVAKLTPLLANKGWTLCIGAGTSIPMFPSWQSLVKSMLEKDLGASLADKLITPLGTTFGLDALLQAGRDRLGLSSEDFANLLSEQLYADVKRTLSKKEWKLLSRALTSLHPGNMPVDMWREFVTITRSSYGCITALPLAHAVVHAMNENLRPSAILSFNAEPLLCALINALVATSFGIAKRSASSLKAVMDRVTRSVSNRDASRIPFAFCHGLLPVESKFSPKGTAVDKLVFSESDYLQLANSGFSLAIIDLLRLLHVTIRGFCWTIVFRPKSQKVAGHHAPESPVRTESSWRKCWRICTALLVASCPQFLRGTALG